MQLHLVCVESEVFSVPIFFRSCLIFFCAGTITPDKRVTIAGAPGRLVCVLDVDCNNFAGMNPAS